MSPLEHLISLNLYRTSVSQTALLAILCNNRDLQNLNLSACPNIQGDEVLNNFSYCHRHENRFQVLEGTRKNAQCLSFTLHLLPNPHPSFKSPPTPRFAWSSRAASSPHLTLHFLSHLQVCLVLSCCHPHLTCLDLWRCSSLTARGVAALAACTQLKVTPSQPLSCEHSLMKISK